MTARFDSPRAIVTGGGCRAQAADLLSGLHAHRTLIVVDPYFASAEFVSEIRAALDRKGIAAGVFTDFQPDPTDQNVLAGAGQFAQLNADSIYAIGGGKRSRCRKDDRRCNCESRTREPVSGLSPDREPRAAARCDSTTAGTGSEATKVAVITDTARNVKMMILDEADAGSRSRGLRTTSPCRSR
jgi:alcohol dehydrogenase class IV